MVVDGGLQARVLAQNAAAASDPCRPQERFDCEWRDETDGSWNSEGCDATDSDAEAGTMTCRCSHLTEFAVVLRANIDPLVTRLLFCSFVAGVSHFVVAVRPSLRLRAGLHVALLVRSRRGRRIRADAAAVARRRLHAVQRPAAGPAPRPRVRRGHPGRTGCLCQTRGPGFG
jgi:hypothetical protein